MTIYGKNAISNEKLLLTRCWGVSQEEGTNKHFYDFYRVYDFYR